jgi:hypothetical protein
MADSGHLVFSILIITFERVSTLLLMTETKLFIALIVTHVYLL